MGIPVVERQRDSFYSTAIWQTLRREALSRDGHQCTRIVDGSRCPERATTVHHIIDRKDGGLDRLDNLASLCRCCHNAVHPEKRASRNL